MHIAIIGAGPGGLITAMRLAAAGYRVSIYEAEDRVGGRMRGFDNGPYAFDTGPTILQVPQTYERLFADVGLRFSDYVTLLPLDPNTRIKFWDGTHLDLTSNTAAFKQQLASFDPALPEAYDRWYVEHIRKYEVGYAPYLGTPVRPVLEYLNGHEIAAALPFRPWDSLLTHFQRYFPDERVAYAFAYQAKYLGMHPAKCSSVFSLVAWLEFAYGVWHPQGGFRALAQGLARAAADLGVEIHLDRPVRQVLLQGDRAAGLLLEDGERVAADAVVVNADFGYAVANLLPPAARGRYTAGWLARKRFSCSTFMMYLGVDRRYDALPHHQLYLSSHIKQQGPPYGDDTRLDEQDPSFYVCNPTIVDPDNAPDGHSTLFVLVPIPNTKYGVDWPAKRESFRQLILDRMALLGYEGVQNHIRAERIFTAETWRDDFRTHLGAVFNLTHGWAQLGPLRPHIRSGASDGLYFIGGAVHPGSGLLTILEASRSAAQFIGEDLPSPAHGRVAARG